MYYQRRRRLYSQNYLRSPGLVDKLIRSSSIGEYDTVLEIGSGRGIITGRLSKVARSVIGIERDKNLYRYLSKLYGKVGNIKLYCTNILYFNLPTFPFKVFANIPFIITASLIRKLTSDKNFREGYLVVQKEAAKKFIGMPYSYENSMMSILLKPYFGISIFHEFARTDFHPVPNVDTVMIRIIRLRYPIIESFNKALFKNFIMYTFNRSKVARLGFTELIKLFRNFVKYSSPGQKRRVEQEAARVLRKQELIQKIYRTRMDRNWRKYK
jgi:16S rRNA A1518/A1519 N6-dimethyltransferase RsmA/KsgA/DIM1 with predicted DNA glycosylase/AP lyase activity